MRRKPGALLPIECAIFEAAADLLSAGVEQFHGYELAKRITERANHKTLTAHGTLYRALGRLEGMRLLESEWEDPAIASRESRPGRRLYRLTPLGERAAQEFATNASVRLGALRKRFA